MAVPPLNFSLNPSSASDTGEVFFDTPANFTFGAKNAASPATGEVGNSMFAPLIKDIAVGLAVALIAKYAWEKIK